MPDRSHDEAMFEYYQERPEDALAVMNDILEDGEPSELLILLRQMTGTVVAPTITEPDAQRAIELFKTLSAESDPTMTSLMAVLKSLGLQLHVQRSVQEHESAA